ncbi:MAG: SPOR domain-containing protein, partial [Pseudomonadales bacterium]
MRRIFCLLALLWGNSGYADTEYWISVGSYRDLASAEEFLTQASRQLQESFSISPADTPSGYFYRVIAGPYLTRDSAVYTLQRAHDAGFADAWMLSTEGPETAYRATTFDELDIDLPPVGELPVIPRRLTIPKTKPPLEPVREAPEGYKLHKLHRDALRNSTQLHNDPYRLTSTDPDVHSTLAAGDVCGFSDVSPPLQDLQVDMLSGKPLVLRRFEDDVTEIKIDGRLDEPQWGMVRSFDNLKVVEPDTLVNGRYATDIRMFYTERGLYVSFDMEQPRDTIVKRFSTRD